MAHPTSRKNWIMIFIGVISLIGLLSYTFVHTGNLLATYVEPRFVGFLAAFGIEMSIIGLSMRIGELKKSGLSTRFFVSTLVMVVIVSAVANIAQGFSVRYGEAITIANFQKLDLVEAFIAIAATGLISLVTLALSEIVGQDVIAVQKAQKKAERSDVPGGYTVIPNEEEQLPPTPNVPQISAPEEKSYRIMTQDEFNNVMISLGKNAPQSVSQAASRFSLSHSSAGRLFKNYREEVKNGG